ncbi:MAG: tyrosine-type recombinase/integrase [Patescibacteria group bacterium]|nr:tyrosine-type recombinase/integrase [Patescibacteria group bacterium]MDD4304392.1 tyrosine-type recombinase/integrase [Patescibacteria group bacterium]MDD4695415.1 tyrosine-type recombinase/integrase [Patescibacteria group bacterium]
MQVNKPKKQSNIKSRPTLPLFDDFLLNLQVNNYSTETIYNYERDVNSFINFLESESLDFEKLNKLHIDRYKAYLYSIDRTTCNNKSQEKKLSSFSINRMLSSLRSYLKYLIEYDYKTSILPENIKLVKNIKKHPKIPEFDQLVKLIEAPTKLEKNEIVACRNRAMLELLFSTGMRISEIVNLNKDQIDSNGRIFILGKGKKERFVYITERAKRYLGYYLSKRKDNCKRLFVPLRGLNSSKKDTKVSTNYLQERIKFYREILNINVPISAHSLRHGFATYLAENGASPAAIQILLGHESLDTTTRYVHASDRFAESAQKKFHPLSK